jgi:hypothetical protein
LDEALRERLGPALMFAGFVMDETRSAETIDQFHRNRKASDISRGKSKCQDDSPCRWSVKADFEPRSRFQDDSSVMNLTDCRLPRGVFE